MVTECVVNCYSSIFLFLILEKAKKPPIINCTECEELVCKHCSLNDHEDHRCELMEKTSPEDKAKFLTEKKSLKVLSEKLLKARDKVRSTILDVNNQQLATINNLRTKFKELHNILEQREQELVEDATNIAKKKLQILSQQEQTLCLASAELQSVVDYTKGCEKLSSISSSMNTELSNAIQQKIQEHSRSDRSLEPVEEADMAVEVTCAEDLQQLCLTQANITTAIDPAKCTVDLAAPAEVGKPYVGTLTTRLSNGKPSNRKCKATCHIKSLYDGVTTDCGIVKDGPGRYSIQCTPTVRGRHELTVLINGHPVAGSPFPVYVSIHPTQLGKPVKIWTEIAKPCGITANCKGEILVVLCNSGIDIVKYDAEKKRVDLVEKSGLVTPHCIACDDEDNIYCVDQSSNKILRCDGNGDKLKIDEVKLEEDGFGRTALAIMDKKLFMAENQTVGIIKVYSKQLQLLSTIKHRNMGVVMGMSVDIHQNLYVTDIDNKACVHVFTKDGVHVNSIGHNKKVLKKPWGLCVCDQYLYVTDTTSHCVFVFTTDGEYVTSFGQKGKKEGDFNWPCYTCADKNGFIYVTDFLNYRTQCF